MLRQLFGVAIACACVAAGGRAAAEGPLDAPAIALRSPASWSHETRVDRTRVVQVGAGGVNVMVSLSRLGRDGRVLMQDEGVFLVTLRAGVWRVQARSLMGT